MNNPDVALADKDYFDELFENGKDQYFNNICQGEGAILFDELLPHVSDKDLMEIGHVIRLCADGDNVTPLDIGLALENAIASMADTYRQNVIDIQTL